MPQGTFTATHRRCQACGKWKPYQDFHRRSDRPTLEHGRDARSTCRSCINAERRRRHKRSPTRKAFLKRRARLIRKYGQEVAEILERKARILKVSHGITLEEYEAIYDAQHGRCRICHRPAHHEHSGVLCIDHHHETGCIRGLLCVRCNRAIGLFSDNPTLLRRAAQYLEQEHWELTSCPAPWHQERNQRRGKVHSHMEQ